MKRRVNRALLLVALGHLVIEFTNGFMPVLYPVLVPIMGLSFAQVGIIALVASTAVSLAQPIFGYFSDRWDSVWIVAISIAWIGVAMGLVGFATSYPMLLLLVGLGSLGSAAFHPPATVIAAANSGVRRGSGLSIFSVGGSVGIALSPLWMAFALGVAGLSGTISVLPLAAAFAVLFHIQMRRTTARTSVAHSAASSSAANGFLVGMLVLIAAMMFRSWYQVAFATYLPTWIESSGGSLGAGGRMLALFLFSGSIGTLVGGASGDRYGYLTVLLVALISLPLTHWAFMNTTGAPQLLSLFLAGAAVGSTYPTSIVLVLEAWPKQAGVASGLLMGLSWWPGGIGASLTGILADSNSLTFALLTLAFVPLLGVACLLAYAVLDRRRLALATPGDA